MPPARKPFRSLRSFTHAARHHPASSEIVSDPILDYDNPTPETNRTPQSLLANQSNFNKVPPTRPPSFSLSLVPSQHNSFSLLPRKPTTGEQPPTPISVDHVNSPCITPNKVQHVFDVEQIVDPPSSPAFKRRRTRSSTSRSAQSSPSPEVDELLLRQLLDNASGEEERKAILAASESARGRRRLRQLVHDDHHHIHREQTPLSSSNNLKNADVQWLGTSYDSVEEVAPTPSPKPPRRTRSDRLTSHSHHQRTPMRARQATIERIDTSESPERIMRRRSRQLHRDINRASTKRSNDRGVETVESSSSPPPIRRRSRRLARVPDQHPAEELLDSKHSDHSETSGESIVERVGGQKQAKKRTKALRSGSLPLPRPKEGLLRERIQRGKPRLLIRKMSSGNRKKKASSRVGDSPSRDSSGPRRSRRLRTSRARRRSILDVDADDEVIEEGSAGDENEDDGSNLAGEDEVSVEEVVDEDDEEDGDIQFEDDEDDEGDEDDEDDDEGSEEHYWQAELKRKQIRRRKKRNGRRKRTQPRDVFRTEGEFLTAREQKERLDFLVKQSADIASHLHKWLGEAVRGEKGGNHAQKDTNGDTGDSKGENDATRKKESFAPPSGPGCELQPHQKEGVDWLLTLDSQGLNAILADEMGLGKTIQAVSFLASLVLSGSRGPHLVVAPKNVCQHWADEVRKWYPTELTVVTHMGTSDDRLERLKTVLEEDKFDILVTSFDNALSDLFTRKRRDGLSWEHLQVLRAFRKVEFEYLIVDEAHRLKNDSTKTNRAIRAYTLAQRRILLTGTPLSNDLKELWSLMNVLNPRIFSSKATFEAWFSAPFASKTKKRLKVSLTHAEQSVIVDRLHTVIRPFFRRRVRADVCPTFTSADEVVIRCPLSGLQRALLFHLQRRAASGEAGINNVIMAMRAASNHPYVASEALYNEEALVSQRLVSSSGKFVFLHYALPRLIKTGHRVLIFSQFKRVLDFIEDLLIVLKLKFERLDGDTSDDERTNGLIEFNREASDIPVFLLTTRAGGIGLNLQTADTVILFDSDWNPSADLQAVSRIQRIGQKRTVHILRLVTEKSVDDLIVETARHKLRTQNVAVGAGKFNTSMGAALDSRLRQKDLEELLKRLELQDFTEEREEVAQSASQENGSPESLSPRRVNLTAQDRRFAEWGNQLLRKGESALSSVDIVPIWINHPKDSSDSYIPTWLANDADIESAAKALRCTDEDSAQEAYENCLFVKTDAGRLSKKDRAIRARRQIAVIDISDADSEKETERSEDADWEATPAAAESESDIEIPDDDVVTEMEKKNTTRSGHRSLTMGLAGILVSKPPPCPRDPVPTSSRSIGSSPKYLPSKSLQPTVKDGAEHHQSVAPTDKNDIPDVVHVSGGSEKSFIERNKTCGTQSSQIVSSSVLGQPRASQQHVALRTAHLKRLPPTNRKASGAQLPASQMNKKSNGATGSGGRLRQGVSNGETQLESKSVPKAVHSQQDVYVRHVPPGEIPHNFVGAWDPTTTVTYHPVQHTAFAPVSVRSSHTNLPTWGSGSTTRVFGQVIAPTLPSASGCIPGARYPQVQENVSSGIGPVAIAPRCPVEPTKVKSSSGAKIANAMEIRCTTSPVNRSASKKDQSLRPIVLISEEWNENTGISTEETVSVRPATPKSRRRAGNVESPRKNWQPTSDASLVDAVNTAAPGSKPISADEFGACVEKLKEVTKVLDTQFLEEALLDCNCDTEAAKEMVLGQLTSNFDGVSLRASNCRDTEESK